MYCNLILSSCWGIVVNCCHDCWYCWYLLVLCLICAVFISKKCCTLQSFLFYPILFHLNGSEFNYIYNDQDGTFGITYSPHKIICSFPTSNYLNYLSFSLECSSSSFSPPVWMAETMTEHQEVVKLFRKKEMERMKVEWCFMCRGTTSEYQTTQPILCF